MREHKHLGVYWLIIENEKILLISKVTGPYDGKLDLPGGGIEHTETPEETLIRELQEEADVTVVNKELFGVTSTNILWQMTEDTKEDLHHIGILYKVEIKEEKLKDTPDFLDSEGCNWYDIKTLNKEELSPFAKYVIENIKY